MAFYPDASGFSFFFYFASVVRGSHSSTKKHKYDPPYLKSEGAGINVNVHVCGVKLN